MNYTMKINDFILESSKLNNPETPIFKTNQNIILTQKIFENQREDCRDGLIQHKKIACKVPKEE
jgi:hypothetical protein